MAGRPKSGTRSTQAFRYIQFNAIAAYPYAAHQHFEIFYVRKGTVTVTVDETTVTLKPGDLSLGVPFVFHKNEASQELSAEILNIAPYLCPEAEQLFGSRRPIRPYLRSGEVPPLVRELLSSVGQITQALAKPTSAEPVAYILDRERSKPIQPYLLVLLLELYKVMPLSQDNEQNTFSMQRVLKYCTDNFTQEITRESVAKECDVSLVAVSQTFSRLGVSFRDYVNTLRVNRAYQLLTTTKKPITEIIYECGYSNQGTFNRNFQTQFGLSPRDIRHGK